MLSAPRSLWICELFRVKSRLYNYLHSFANLISFSLTFTVSTFEERCYRTRYVADRQRACGFLART